MIVGNKVDLFEEDSERPVTTQNGKKLAEVLMTLVLDNFPEYFGMTVKLRLHDGVVQKLILVVRHLVTSVAYVPTIVLLQCRIL